MLVYEVKSLPDLSLSKYQVFADSGIDGMLEAQTQFIKQLHRVLMLGKVNAHILFQYSPKRRAGNRLRIFLFFTSENTDSAYFTRLKQIVCASGI